MQTTNHRTLAQAGIALGLLSLAPACNRDVRAPLKDAPASVATKTEADTAGEPPADASPPSQAQPDATTDTGAPDASSSAPIIDSSDSEPPFSMGAMLRHLVDNVIVESYAEFASQAATMERRAASFCDAQTGPAPSAAAPADAGSAVDGGVPSTDPAVLFNELRQSWHQARGAWKQTEAFAFGPYRDQPYRIGPKLDTYPIRSVSLSHFLVDEHATPEALAQQGTGLRGLATMEVLLFEEHDIALDQALFNGSSGEQRCDYVVALGTDIATLAEQMVAAWVEDYGPQIKTAGSSSKVFERQHDALSEIVNRLVFSVENVRELKVGKPGGLLSGGNPLPGLFESPHSGRSAQDAIDAMVSVERIYLGQFGDSEALGIRDALLARDSKLDAAMMTALKNAKDSLAAAHPFLDTLEQAPERLRAAYDTVKELQLVIAVDIAAALGVTVTFNDTDGD